MRSTITRSLTAVVLGAGLVLGSAACSTEDVDAAKDKAGNAAADATDAVGDAAGKAGDAAGDAADKAGDAISGTGEIDGTEVPAGIADKYEELGGADALGALGEVTEENGVTVAVFDNARIYDTPDNGAVLIQGKILETWLADGGAESELGLPIRDEAEIEGGWISYFENGSMTWTVGEDGEFGPTTEIGATPED